MTASSLALIATVRGLDGSFLTWLHHHHDQGFHRIFLVFDAPDEDREAIDAIRSDSVLREVVRCIENDARHQERVRSLPQYGILQSGYDRTVVYRQMLNVGAVMHRAIEEGITWLLHLDADELLAPYSPDVPVARYFERVPDHFDEVIFPNFEAVPEAEQIGDPFLEVTLFKKSPYYMCYREFELLYTAWDGHSGAFKLFNGYITGKSALRMRDANIPFVPASVHHFLPIRFNRNVHIEDGGGPIVLHYPHCGLDRFIQRFTGFNRDRVNTYDGRGFTEDLYRRASELVREGREHELSSLYHRLVMLDDARLRSRLRNHGFLTRRAPPRDGPNGHALPAASFEKDPAGPAISRATRATPTTELSDLLRDLALHPTLDAKGSLTLATEAGPKLIKRVYPETLREQAFLVTRSIPGLCLHNRSQLFSWDEKLYQVIDVDAALTRVEDPLDALDIVQLYVYSNHITMLGPRLGIDELIRSHHVNYHVVKGDGHPRAREVELESFVDLFHSSTRDLWPEDEARFRSGLFHEDLQTGNILAGRGLLHIIDLDPIWHTYSVMNLAHFFVMEVLGKRRLGALDAIREHFVAALEQESERDFDFFVLLALYRALLRRAFHRDIFADSIHSDFAWYFRELGLDLYLRRVAGRG